VNADARSEAALERRDLRRAAIAAALLHLPVFFAGNAAVDSRPAHSGAGQGIAGDSQVIALSPLEAERWLSRRGAPRLVTPSEAGGAGSRTEQRPQLLAPPRPPGPVGPALGGGPLWPSPVSGTGRAGEGLVAPPPRDFPGPLPEALPAPPSPRAGALPQPAPGATESAESAEGPDRVGRGEPAGSDGQAAADRGARDGDRARSLDARVWEAIVLYQVAPDYPASLVASEPKITGQVRIELRIGADGTVLGVRFLPPLRPNPHQATFERLAEVAVRRWRFDPQAVAAHGVAGQWLAGLTLDFKAP
jgi:TonB family protein